MEESTLRWPTDKTTTAININTEDVAVVVVLSAATTTSRKMLSTTAKTINDTL